MGQYMSVRLVVRWVVGAVRLILFDLVEGWLNLAQLARSIAMGGVPFVVRVRKTGHSFKVLSAGDVWTVDEVLVRNEYYWDQIQVPPDARIIDIGGNIGAFAVWAGSRFPHGTIYSYEPYPDNFALLLDNLARNGIRNVYAFRLAVWGRCATLAMETGLPFACMYSTCETKSPGDQRLRVQAVSLDSILGAHDLDRCDILKLDCEGAEYEILMSAPPVTLHRVRFILAEYHDNRVAMTHADLVDHLTMHGFLVEIRPSRDLKDVGHLFAVNQQFVHP